MSLKQLSSDRSVMSVAQCVSTGIEISQIVLELRRSDMLARFVAM